MNSCLVLPVLLLAEILASASGEEISNNCFENAVGISNPSVIPGNHLTASSQRGALYQPAYGRLGSTSGDGWCAKEADRNDDWLQVDLGNIFEVCGVGSQGNREKDIDEWVTAFTISYSLYGSRWERYKDGNNEEFEFLRSGRSINQQRLPVPLVARYIRFHPTKQENWNCLSVEVFGTETIPDKCINYPVGVSNPTTILDNQMKASSQYDEDHQAAYGRLQDKRGDAWCAEEHDRNDDWLQVDLGKTIEVCAVATQGDMHDEHWVTTFKVSYSSNGDSWKTYTKYGKEVEFHREGGANTVDHHGFPSPVFARFIRFHPTGQHDWNCLKVEVYGTQSDGCVTLTDDDPSIDDDVTIDKMKWFETPSFVTFAPGTCF
ncbi:lactadherin-like [Oculina patagonica]